MGQKRIIGPRSRSLSCVSDAERDRILVYKKRLVGSDPENDKYFKMPTVGLIS